MFEVAAAYERVRLNCRWSAGHRFMRRNVNLHVGVVTLNVYTGGRELENQILQEDLQPPHATFLQLLGSGVRQHPIEKHLGAKQTDKL